MIDTASAQSRGEKARVKGIDSAEFPVSSAINAVKEEARESPNDLEGEPSD